LTPISFQGTHTYIYDGHNRRVKQTDSKGTSYSLYSKAGTLLYRETDDGGINYIYLGKKLIAKDGVIPKNSGPQHYRPFGSSIEGEVDDVGYTGHKYDEDLGLSYMQARYYDPVIGRFYSNDPLGFRDVHSFNRYAYANNNPYKYVDPDGEASFLVSRPLKKAPGLVANHNFIVSNAEFVGDPNATVYSFGKTNEGKIGKVNAETQGFSEGTEIADTEAWASLSSASEDIGDSITQIFADDATVDAVASSVVEDNDYGIFGVNSNSAASAVADKSQGSKVDLPSNYRASPGAGNADKIKFKPAPLSTCSRLVGAC